MASDNTDFLRFSAYSIKDLITRKLTQDSNFTDQVYEGSNLAVLIDIFSYLGQGLLYLLNNAASESMFSDTQIYENMNRLCRFIGYYPKGFQTSQVQISITSSNGSLRSKIIPKYSRVDTGLTDTNGNKIYFSSDRNKSTLKDSTSQQITLYNGEWKMFNTIFTASGTENETFVLTGLKSDSDSKRYVANNFIDVYIRKGEDEWETDWNLDVNGVFMGYSASKNAGTRLFNSQTAFKSIYPGNYKVYTVYLDEQKNYVLKFGNGIVGKKLEKGDRIYVMYLETNGNDGYVQASDIDQSSLKFENSKEQFGMTDEIYDNIVEQDSSSIILSMTPEQDSQNDDDETYALSFYDNTSSTPKAEETVQEIRENAPLWYATGNRLVTKSDYEYYIKTNKGTSSSLGCTVVDCKCMNNYEYITKFYKWLYDLGNNGKYVQYESLLGLGNTSNYRKYLQKTNFIRKEYFYADSSDSNNVYIWIKSPNEIDASNVTRNMNQTLMPIKMMTTELVACNAIDVNFDICACPEEYALYYYLQDSNDNTVFDQNCESYIEITLDDNVLYVENSIKQKIYNIIVDGFNVNNMQLGQVVKYDSMLDKIYSIAGVERVRTVFQPSTDSTNFKYHVYDGLAFASWSNATGFVDIGDDIDVSNTMRSLQDFQFPVFKGQNMLMNRIRLIKKTLSEVNLIKF